MADKAHKPERAGNPDAHLEPVQYQDAAILAAAAEQRELLAVIEANGDYYDCEKHSPTETEAFDAAERVIAYSEGSTVEAALEQAWIAMTNIEGNTADARKARMFALHRNIDSLTAMSAPEYGFDDWSAYTLFRVLKTLHNAVTRATNDATAWDQALADYRAKHATAYAMPTGSPGEDEAVEAYCAAADILFAMPAPNAGAVAAKLEIAKDIYDGFVFPDRIIDAAVADLKRFGGEA